MKIMKPDVKTILIVDDEPNARTVLRDILEVYGYRILEAENGSQALDILQQDNVDLLITDRSMPVMGGLELLQTLRDQKRKIRALVISAFGEERLWAEAIGLGAEDYILKPFETEDVIKAVQKYLTKPKGKA